MRKKTGYIQPHGNRFRIAYYSDGVRQFESFPTRDEAERELANRLAAVANCVPVSSGPHTVLFGELAADVITDFRVNKRRSLDDLNRRLTKHILPVFGDRKAASITTAQLTAYIETRQAETFRGKTPETGTINRELEAIRHILKLAIKGGKLLYMPHVPHMAEDNVREGFFTPAEVARVVTFLPKAYALFVRFLFLTGWRKGEARDLKWSNVSFADNVIRIEKSVSKKSKHGRVVPMTADLRALLIEARQAQGDEEVARISTYVFGIGGKPVLEFRKSWNNACLKAGLPYVQDPATGRKKALAIVHDLRRSAGKHYIKSGLRENDVMSLMGHRTRSMFDRYQITSDADMLEAVGKLNAASSS